MHEVFARKLRHHEDIADSAGKKSKQKKEANMIDEFVNAFWFFFVHFS